MAKVIIDTESEEAREYFAYLLWYADNGSKPGARTNKRDWSRYTASAGEFLENLAIPIPTTVYAPASSESTEMNRVDFREAYAGIETVAA